MEDSSVFSQSTKDVSSAISLYNMPTGDDGSIRGMIDFDGFDEAQSSGVSRPLSRSSVTSSLSMVATKDGVEGRRVHRYGIPQYSLNLLNSMSQSPNKGKTHNKQYYQHQKPQQPVMETHDSFANHHVECPLPGSPMTLTDKMQFLNDQSDLPQRDSSMESFQERSTDISGGGMKHSVLSSKGPITDTNNSSDDYSN